MVEKRGGREEGRARRGPGRNTETDQILLAAAIEHRTPPASPIRDDGVELLAGNQPLREARTFIG